MEEKNRGLYASPAIVRWYATCSKLQGAERRMLEELRPRLPGLRMLDVGVGGGRTTVHFAPAVREYVGIDYIPAMIDACRSRFAGRPFRFEVGDARDLAPLATASFDLVLFSHCGIDYVDEHGRASILCELRRVLAPGGLLLFATHNLGRARELLAPRSPWKRLVRWRTLRRLRRENPDWTVQAQGTHAELNDGAFNFSLRTFHIRPSHQIHQLESLGYRDVRVLHRDSGVDLPHGSVDGSSEPWLYFAAHHDRSDLLETPHV